MPVNVLKVLCLHGLGDHRNSTWKEDWTKALEQTKRENTDVVIEPIFITYDDIFEQINPTFTQSAVAFYKLVRSGTLSILGSRSRGQERGLNDWMKWYAGYVVAWVEDKKFQTKTRERLLSAIKEHKPDVLAAHSLGSLISYNTLSHEDALKPEYKKLVNNLNFISLGSQIANAFVIRNTTPGGLRPLPVKFWYHLYNREDNVFTAPIKLWSADNFEQVETFFDIKGMSDHDAPSYLQHDSAITQVWQPLLAGASGEFSYRNIVPKHVQTKNIKTTNDTPQRKALLIGINDYPNPDDRLEGCVNDVYLMSAVLQESGFKPEDIRICLNERATGEGILSRLNWLMENPKPKDQLVFYFSGHGAQLPTYGMGDQVDRMDETLVPYDFDWSLEKCITDDQIFGLYSQLPYDTRLAMIFDCCHSGGIHRSGSRRVKGLTPPDDIRHRALRWDSKLEMWVPREFEPINQDFSPDEELNKAYFGRTGSVNRLGRASALRGLNTKAYDKSKESASTIYGPYLPVIMQACDEGEYSYEYRHGSISYGAYTFCLAKILREVKKISFADLNTRIRERLVELEYPQVPQILGPDSILKTNIPRV